ncbi:MAG TPA: glycosyltransferase [Candidatus Deferrimicrobium sp.]|nr:glycosyltransferase [Candidatus Deferrimicrobium sp.]
MANRRILLVCYYFPPLGGAGVGRPLTLVKYLPQCGFDCDVLTVKPVAYRVFEPELLDGIDDSRIYRSGSYDPQRLMYLAGIRVVKDRVIRRGRKLSERFFPDSKAGWVKPAVRLGRTLCTNRRYDLILSTSPPISAHLVAQKLAREYKLPWVSDFRDFWTLHKAEDSFRSSRRIAQAQHLLKAIRKDATAVTAVNPSVAAYVSADEVIYNSYDSELARLWRPPVANDQYTIGLLGTLNDLYPIESLLKTVAAVRERSPERFERIRFLQVGDVDMDWLRGQFERYGLWQRCSAYRFQPRRETIGILSQASLFYLGLASSKERGVILGRTFMLLASGRPILASVPPGSEMERLISETGCGHCFQNETVSSAAAYLINQIALHEEGRLSIVAQPEYAERFSSENLAENFADLFTKVQHG